MTFGGPSDGLPRSIRAAILILSLTAVTSLFAQPDSSVTADLLLKYEQQLLDVLDEGDTSMWDRFLHDNCIIVIEDGSTQSKSEFLASMNPLPPGYVGRIRVTSPTIRVYGDVATLTFVDDETLELYGQFIHTYYRQTDTWIRIEGRWHIVVMTIFEIPANPLPVIIPVSILEQYSGVYALSPERLCSVYVHQGGLYAIKGGRPAQRLLAETESMFFRDGDGRVNVLFRRNELGTFDMIERREGQDLVWRLRGAR
jgi:hypothetical protein